MMVITSQLKGADLPPGAPASFLRVSIYQDRSRSQTPKSGFRGQHSRPKLEAMHPSPTRLAALTPRSRFPPVGSAFGLSTALLKRLQDFQPCTCPRNTTAVVPKNRLRVPVAHSLDLDPSVGLLVSYMTTKVHGRPYKHAEHSKGIHGPHELSEVA